MRRVAISAAVLASGAALWAACVPAREAPRHVVVIVADTLRADRMSIYGHPRETTPYLSEIEGELVVYERAKAPAPWTVPSHASLFTGLAPEEHRAQWGHAVLGQDAKTLAEVLSGAGFRTIGLCSNPFISPERGFARGFDRYAVLRGKTPEGSAQMLDRLPSILDEAGDERVFLFLNFMDAHIPYNTRVHGESFGVRGSGPIDHAAIKWQVSAGQLRMNDAQRAEHEAAYDAAVRYLDDLIRDLFLLLEDRGLLDESVVVITSDHGDGLGAHPELGHSLSVWEEQLAIPLIVRFPRGASGGRRPAGLASLSSVPPSVLDWLQVPRPPALVGAPDLDGTSDAPVIAEYRSYFSESGRRLNVEMAQRYPDLARRVLHQHVLYCGSHKLIADARGNRVLFDLAVDPNEQRPLDPGASAACVERYEQLAAAGRFTAFDRLPSDEERRESDATHDPELLRSLGYIQ